MNIRFATLQRHIASATAAIAVSALFITAAIGPVTLQPTAAPYAQSNIA